MPVYNTAKKKFFDANINLASDTIKVMLLADSYVPDLDTHEFLSQADSHEISGSGYTAGGATLSNKSTTVDTTDNEGVFDADDVVWTNATITARYALIYKDTGSASTSPLIGYIDFGANQSSQNADFTIQWNAEGILNLN